MASPMTTAALAEAEALPNGATFLPPAMMALQANGGGADPATTPAPAATAAADRDASTVAPSSFRQAATAVRPQELTTQTLDTSAFSSVFDVARCVALQVEHGVYDLFPSLAAYISEADSHSTSLSLPVRQWKESERMDDDDASSASGDAFIVRTHAGTGVHAVVWRGRTVWAVVAVGRSPSMRGDYPRSIVLYSEVDGAPLLPLDGGVEGDAAAAAGEAAADAATGEAADGQATSAVAAVTNGVAKMDVGASALAGAAAAAAAADPSPAHATAREHLASFVKHVVAWERSRSELRLPTHFELHRYKVEETSRGRWHAQGVHLTRSVDSVILDTNMRDALLADARSFGEPATRQFYASHGVPYRRCYLFYGPPGTGKSSFVRVLAGFLQRSVSYLQAAHNKMTDSLLADAFRDCPRNTILVLEDLDCLFSASIGGGGVGARESRGGVGITLSGLLNALDGLISGTGGRITVLSSNHPGLLDTALVRPGRVDMALRFARPGRAALAALFSSFYPGEDHAAAASAFADAVEGGGHSEESRSIASLQQLFIKHRKGTAADVLADVVPFLDAMEESREDMSGQKGRGTASLYV